MTNEEAIQIIKSECYVANLLNLDRTRMINTALDKAIESLEPKLHGYKIDFFTAGVASWLSTFNTDSATDCFTAVQELKKSLEGSEKP